MAWEVRKLGDVSNIMYGYTESASIKEIGPKFLRITDIQDSDVNWDTVPYCKINESDFKKHKLIHGDIVFARTGATTGKSYLLENPPDSVAASYLIKVHLENSKLKPEFLYQYFQSGEYWDIIKIGKTGSTLGGFNATKLSELEIPIPPLAEQKRIVAILDEAFLAISTAKENAEKNLKNAKELFESYLNNIFEKKGKDWEEKKLGEVCDILNGGTPDTKIKEYWDGNNLWITPKDMGKLNSIFVSVTERKISDSGLKNSSAKLIQPYSIILSSRAPIGHLAINTLPMATNQGCKGIIPKKTLNYLFLYYFLKKSVPLLDSLGSGTTFKELSGTKLSEVQLPFPSLKEQQRIVSKLDALSEQTKKLEAVYSKKIADLDELKKSILQKAFKGEL